MAKQGTFERANVIILGAEISGERNELHFLLLGLFGFGILTKRILDQKYIWAVCILAPLFALGIDILSSPEWYETKLHVSLGLKDISKSIFNEYKIGNELILINGLLTFLGLYIISKPANKKIVTVAA